MEKITKMFFWYNCLNVSALTIINIYYKSMELLILKLNLLEHEK